MARERGFLQREVRCEKSERDEERAEMKREERWYSSGRKKVARRGKRMWRHYEMGDRVYAQWNFFSITQERKR